MSEPLDIASQMQAVLFAEGGPVTRKRLASILEIDDVQIEHACSVLADRIRGTSLSVIRTDSEVALVLSPEAGPVMEKLYERELGREIGDAGLEVISIILYRGPSTRAHIDYIRGVNTSSTVRLLTSRGLIERVPNPADGREYLYKATTELLAHMGVTSQQELPDYAKIHSELATFEHQSNGPFESTHAPINGEHTH